MTVIEAKVNNLYICDRNIEGDDGFPADEISMCNR